MTIALAIIVLALFAVFVAGPVILMGLHDGHGWFSYTDAVKSTIFVLGFLAGSLGCLVAISWAIRTLKDIA